ncbi:MAG: DUF898 family protein [Chitinispirillia bacterium]|nr:DUF898 family protein [Chitinispirillia bacterium]MCL2267700.1 DUF898 family protein [Chitinispirillia bacterium]
MAFCTNCGKEVDGFAVFCEECEAARGAADNKPSDVDLSTAYKLSFQGNSGTLFKIWISNLLLTICTLSVYYSWARANMKRYIYSSTYIGDYAFEFHGTGGQMFKGLIKFSIMIFVLNLGWEAVKILVQDGSRQNLIPIIGLTLLLLISYFPIMGLFIHGARRFRMSRTTYRGIRFGYRGNKASMIKLLFTVLIPFYYPAFVNRLRKYIYGNTHFGNIEAEFKGDSATYFNLYWRNLLLCVVTLGIYYFWYKAKLFNYFWNNLSFSKDSTVIEITPKATAQKFFNLLAGNFLIVLFTLGLGSPIAKVRSMKFLADNLDICGNADLDTVIQTEEQYINALGDAAADMDDAADFFDVDIF